VEGQETANLIGGFSHTNVPFDFVQEVEIKNSGIQAEHGGALGGVVNVVMRKGTNNYHGSVFSQWEDDGLDANQIPPIARYNPLSSQTPTSWGLTDPEFQSYVPKKDHYTNIYPGFTFGGPLRKDRIFFFVGFNPWILDDERSVNYSQPGGLGLGVVKFAQNTRTYYTNARVDAAVTQKLRVYASWLSTSEAVRGELALSRFLAGIFQRRFDDCPIDLLACARVHRAEFHHERRGRLQHHPAADFDRPIWLLFRELS
jgi:hypothetical protein